MTYPREYIVELLCRVDIVEVVKTFVPLRTRGSENQEHFGVCPFHRERTASFVVHRTKQFYHCFGCGAHGKAIKFLEVHSGLSFSKAVMYLAKRYRFYPKQWRAMRRQEARKTK